MITGAAGFMGSALTHALAEEKANIFAFTSERRGASARLEDIANQIELIACDILDLEALKRHVRQIQPQIIYHFASYGNHPEHYVNPDEALIRTTQVNVTGTANLLASLSDTPFECFINTGSPAEYGEGSEPMRETQVLKPVSYYGATKAGASYLCYAFSKLKNLRVLTLIPAYVYGPGEDLYRFIPTLVAKCLKGEPFPLTSLREKKDFIFIDDAIAAFQAAYLSPTKEWVLNIGSGVEITLGEVIRHIESILGKKIQYQEGRYQKLKWERTCWAADIRKASNVLKWRPHYTLEEGLRKSIAEIRKAMLL